MNGVYLYAGFRGIIQMKIFRLLLITLCALTFSCNSYDDSPIWSELQDLKDRVARLEALCETMNSNITALESIVAALQANDYVTGVTPISEEGQKIGYTITFSKSGSVDIYHGKDGTPGASGTPGQDGEDGADGKDGHTPVIGIRKDADGIYYWVLDGEWLTDSEGNKTPTTGKNGEDGNDGQDGKDGITPLLKIENNYWYISYDNGQSWQQLYKAVGENGKDGQNGTPGKDGEDGQSFFQSIDTSDPNYIILTLADGSQIKIPTWKAFEELQSKVNQLNSNLTALQAIIHALESNVYVTEISPIIENSKESGYVIYFSNGQFITIYHGEDGDDGAPGQDGTPGQDGEDGKDGKDGYTPVISVKQGEDGNYYWTIDGKWMNGSENQEGNDWIIDGGWLTDEQGNKIPATGKDGTTPVLKIYDGYWYISYDGGNTWSNDPLGPATVSADGGIFSDISYDDACLYITLTNGESITLARQKPDIMDSCEFSLIDLTYKKATFTGSLNIPKKELQFSQVGIYYSDTEEFNIHTARSASTSSFDNNGSFSISLTNLTAETKYTYCLCVKVRGEEVYSDVKEFQTKEIGDGLYTMLPERQYSGTWCRTEITTSLGGEPTVFVSKFIYEEPEDVKRINPATGEPVTCRLQATMGTSGGFFSCLSPETRTLFDNKSYGKYVLEIGHTYYIKTALKGKELTSTLYDGSDEQLQQPLDSLTRTVASTGVTYEVWLGNSHLTLEESRYTCGWNGLRMILFEMYQSDNTLVFSGTPAIRKSDGVYGVYDIVSESFIPETDELCNIAH